MCVTDVQVVPGVVSHPKRGALMHRTKSSKLLPAAKALLAGTAITTLTFTGAGCAYLGEGPEGPVETEPVIDNASTGGGGGGTTDDDDGNGGATDDDRVSIPLDAPCAEIAQNAKQMLRNNCTSCHGANSDGQGGFANVLDAAALVASGKIVPGKVDESPLYMRVSTGSMPPAASTQRPTPKEVATLKDWILCDAPDWNATVPAAAFLSTDSRLRLMLDDLRSFANPSDRERIRYIDLSNLSNAGFSEAQLGEFREGVTLLLNSLSYGSAVVPATTVDPGKILYRVDLRDYGWSAANWDQITADYPYLVRYDQDSRLFPYDEVTAQQLREQTRTNAPYIQADWLIAHASQPPLYYDVLGVTGQTLDGVARSLGVNIQANIFNGQVARSGFTNSGVSVNNRIIERHELAGRQGAFWVSYDFANNLDFSNIQAHPLDFVPAGGEAIFNLPNGMQAYLIVDEVGRLIDKVPNNIATDPNSRTREVGAGASCMGCHANGIIRKDDTLRDFVLTTALDANEREEALELYVPVAEMTALFEEDNERYARARTTADIVKFDTRSMSRMVNGHEGLLSLGMVAAVLGVPIGELEAALDSTPQAFPPEIVTLRQDGGNISRQAFEQVFEGILQGLGLGTPIVP